MWGSTLLTAVPSFFLAATTSTIKSPTDLSGAFQQIYRDLERPGAICRRASPTIQFSYVTPPVNGTSTWNNYQIQSQDVLLEELQPKASKPIALYLPGLDGYGISACSNQFDDLASTFNLWRMTVLPEDRSSFETVVQSIVDFAQNITDEYPGSNNITFIGESCGGVFASAAAIPLQNKLQGLVLVNPATSFAETQWARLVPLLAQLPNGDAIPAIKGQLTPYSVIGSAVLSTIVPDNRQLFRIFETITALPDFTSANLIQQQLGVLQATVKAMQGVEERLSADLLTHRVMNWLEPNAVGVKANLTQFHRAPTLVVAGQEDRLLPSQDEAKWLQEKLTYSTVETLLVKERGHFVLDDTVNLTEAIMYSKINPLSLGTVEKPFDPITDWRIPSDVHEYIESNVQPLRRAFSPVFYSTDETGRRWKGLAKVPSRKKNGPILFVANHQFIALDLGIIVSELYEKRNILPRGLAHPVAFQARQRNLNYVDLGGRVPGLTKADVSNLFASGFDKYGAVRVSPRNYYRLLQTGQDALLFPGGAAEALSGDPNYPLAWPDKVDFVRTAARFNATIVPLSAVGMVDSFNVIAEPKDLLGLPFIGERLKQQRANTTAARYDRKNDEEFIGVPVSVPKTPSRNYFVFGKPIYTSQLDPNDKAACEKVYVNAKEEVERGLADLLECRSKDPYQDTLRRLAYERLTSKTAPSFDLDVLNNQHS